MRILRMSRCYCRPRPDDDDSVSETEVVRRASVTTTQCREIARVQYGLDITQTLYWCPHVVVYTGRNHPDDRVRNAVCFVPGTCGIHLP